MRKLVLCFGVLMAANAMAAPTQVCPTQMFLSDLLPGGTYENGCYDQGIGYSGFSYTGALAPGSVSVSIGTVELGFGLSQHIVNFQASPAWVASVSTYSYTVATMPGPESHTIYGVDVARTALAPFPKVNTSSVATWVDPNVGPDVTIIAPGVSAAPLVPAQVLQVKNTVTPLGGLTVTQFSNSFYDQLVPEPATYAFLATGLLLMGLAKARRASR